jgi:hypothetical protein
MPLEVTPLTYKLQHFSASNNPLAPTKDVPADQPTTGDPNGSPAPTATSGQGTTPASSAQPASRQPAEPVAQIGVTRLGS